jgi:hypothetical protein
VESVKQVKNEDSNRLQRLAPTEPIKPLIQLIAGETPSDPFREWPFALFRGLVLYCRNISSHSSSKLDVSRRSKDRSVKNWNCVVMAWTQQEGRAGRSQQPIFESMGASGTDGSVSAAMR